MSLDHRVRAGTTRLLLGLCLAVASVGIAASCSVEGTLPVPSCVQGDTAILVAQSVPTASQVPCFDSLPDGWEVASVRIDRGGTVIRLDSDRAGSSAAIFHYTESCSTGAAVDAPSEYDGAEQYELVERVVPALRGRRFHVFPGGCMWWEFDFDAGTPSALSIDLGNRLQMIPREELNRSIRDSFLDEEV